MRKQPAAQNRFCFAEHALAVRATGGWNCHKTDGGTLFLTASDFGRRGFAIDCDFGDEGFYAILDGFRQHASYGYRVDAASGLVWLENGADPVPMNEFLMTAVRADPHGKPVCSFLSRAEDQLYACTEANADGHVDEIIEGRTAFGAVLVEDWLDAARSRRPALDRGEFLSMVA